MELYNAVVDGKYEMALSFLRGFRDIFGQSMIDQIRRMYVGKFILIITRKYGENSLLTDPNRFWRKRHVEKYCVDELERAKSEAKATRGT